MAVPKQAGVCEYGACEYNHISQCGVAADPCEYDDDDEVGLPTLMAERRFAR